jgi:hypothetical protein
MIESIMAGMHIQTPGTAPSERQSSARQQASATSLIFVRSKFESTAAL